MALLNPPFNRSLADVGSLTTLQLSAIFAEPERVEGGGGAVKFGPAPSAGHALTLRQKYLLFLRFQGVTDPGVRDHLWGLEKARRDARDAARKQRKGAGDARV